MKIGIEARMLSVERTGYGHYAYNLISELAKIDNKNKYTIAGEYGFILFNYTS